MKKQKRKIGTKLGVLFIVFSLVLCLGICGFTLLASWNEYTDFFFSKALQTAKTVATMVDGDRLDAYVETGETDAYYEELSRMMSNVKREMDIVYLYIFKPYDDHFVYILDAQVETDDPENISQLGDVYEYLELEYELLVPDVQAGRCSQQKVMASETAYGPGVMAWAPIFGSNGEVVAMVEADITLSHVIEVLRDYLISMVLIFCGLILVLVLGMLLLTRRMVTLPLGRLTRNVLEFAQGGRLDSPPAPLETGDEMQTLSEAFGKMAQDIDQYTQNLASVAADKERIATELTLATDIQISLLPRSFPAFPGRDEFDIHATMQPAKVVGGDFYDFFLIDQRRLGVVVGGVSGRGIPAALFMVVAKTIIKNQLMTGMPVEEAMGVINARLYESSTSDMTVKAFVGVLDTADGSFAYVNAGQCAPLAMRKGNSYEFLTGQEIAPLAQTEHVSYRRMELRLRQGDRMLFYSDGVLQAKDHAGKAYGADRLRAALNARRSRDEDLSELVRTMCEEVAAFQDGVTPEDDMTLLALAYNKGDRALAEVAVRAREDGFAQAQKFLKRQLQENGLGGAFYARLCVAVEEAFALVTGRIGGRGELIVRCAVAEAPEGGQEVTISLLYGGPELDPLQGLNDAQRDALAFVRRSMDAVEYAHVEGKNIVRLRKRA